MRLQETIERDVKEDIKSAIYYKGYVFPRYEGKLTRDEFQSGLVFYSFWGDRYLTKRALEVHVDEALQRRQIPEAA